MLPNSVDLIEVGPREGFQYEGADHSDRISTARKLDLIRALSHSGLRTIQVASFVSPRAMPQMADAEEICAGLPVDSAATFTAIYLNDAGLARALAAPGITIQGELILSASEPFALRNQRRDAVQERAAQHAFGATYARHGVRIDTLNIMAAFGCNWGGITPLARLIDLIEAGQDIAAAFGGAIGLVNLADTMGWGNPELIRHTIGTIRDRFPGIRLGLHLHDTRGLGIANVYAGLIEGVDRFDTGVGGLGGCPFAGNEAAAGNVSTEEVVFLCDQLGIETGVDLDALRRCASLAETIVGHALPSTLIHTSGRVPAEMETSDDL